eukprot:366279-Chlamydomonas_euryale.AAC.15
MDLNGRSLIDYGAGSGVLALAALKFGASAAVGRHVVGVGGVECGRCGGVCVGGSRKGSFRSLAHL